MMNNRVFISGSISIKKLPDSVLKSLSMIIQNKLQVLVGDADGIDSLVQDYFNKNSYQNVIVYSIHNVPRYIGSSSFKFKKIEIINPSKKERENQREKDLAMTEDSNYSLVIWDGKSKGSFDNIIRALDANKKVKVFISELGDFLEQDKVNLNEIKYIYYENNGYSASEIINHFHEEGKEYFKSSRDLNKFLMDKKIIQKKEDIYEPITLNELFIVEKYKGKISGIKFKNSFIDWIDGEMRKLNSLSQDGFNFG